MRSCGVRNAVPELPQTQSNSRYYWYRRCAVQTADIHCWYEFIIHDRRNAAAYSNYTLPRTKPLVQLLLRPATPTASVFWLPVFTSRNIAKAAIVFINALEFRGSATSNNVRLVHWPLMGGLLHLVQRGCDWAGPQPAQLLYCWSP